MVNLTPNLKLATALGLMSTSAAHMIMNTPTPYDSHHLSTSPLGPSTDGTAAVSFPCHGNFDITEVSNITAGTTQTVKFTGSAVHGGGSCQFSVNYGSAPSTDPSDWKVIYTIIGGCPASAQGNIEGSAPNDSDGRPDGRHCGDSRGTECVRQFDIPIPKGLPNGRFSFAWTWFNKIGNREMYMNCAPMVMSGGADEKDTGFLDSLPSIFVANVAGLAECTTGNGVLNVPDAGRAGAVLEEPTPGSEGTCPKADGPDFDRALSGVLGGQSISTGSGSGSGSESPSGEEGSSSSAAVSSAVTSSSAAAGFSVSSAPPAPPAATTMQTIATVAPSSAAPATVSSGGTGSGSSTGSGGTAAVPCSTEGALICMDAGYFGICDHGSAVRMPLAAGTTCQDGKIVRRSV